MYLLNFSPRKPMFVVESIILSSSLFSLALKVTVSSEFRYHFLKVWQHEKQATESEILDTRELAWKIVCETVSLSGRELTALLPFSGLSRRRLSNWLPQVTELMFSSLTLAGYLLSVSVLLRLGSVGEDSLSDPPNPSLLIPRFIRSEMLLK